MDLNQAAQAHSEWKVKLRAAITKRETLDVATISADNCCPLGKWLHGDAKGKYNAFKSYSECVSRHAAFHREAGAVAKVVNAKQYAQAEAMLSAGTPFMSASAAAGSAILGLKKEVGQAA